MIPNTIDTSGPENGEDDDSILSLSDDEENRLLESAARSFGWASSNYSSQSSRERRQASGYHGRREGGGSATSCSSFQTASHQHGRTSMTRSGRASAMSRESISASSTSSNTTLVRRNGASTFGLRRHSAETCALDSEEAMDIGGDNSAGESQFASPHSFTNTVNCDEQEYNGDGTCAANSDPDSRNSMSDSENESLPSAPNPLSSQSQAEAMLLGTMAQSRRSMKRRAASLPNHNAIAGVMRQIDEEGFPFLDEKDEEEEEDHNERPDSIICDHDQDTVPSINETWSYSNRLDSKPNERIDYESNNLDALPLASASSTPYMHSAHDHYHGEGSVSSLDHPGTVWSAGATSFAPSLVASSVSSAVVPSCGDSSGDSPTHHLHTTITNPEIIPSSSASIQSGTTSKENNWLDKVKRPADEVSQNASITDSQPCDDTPTFFRSLPRRRSTYSRRRESGGNIGYRRDSCSAGGSSTYESYTTAVSSVDDEDDEGDLARFEAAVSEFRIRSGSMYEGTPAMGSFRSRASAGGRGSCRSRTSSGGSILGKRRQDSGMAAAAAEVARFFEEEGMSSCDESSSFNTFGDDDSSNNPIGRRPSLTCGGTTVIMGRLSLTHTEERPRKRRSASSSSFVSPSPLLRSSASSSIVTNETGNLATTIGAVVAAAAKAEEYQDKIAGDQMETDKPMTDGHPSHRRMPRRVAFCVSSLETEAAASTAARMELISRDRYGDRFRPSNQQHRPRRSMSFTSGVTPVIPEEGVGDFGEPIMAEHDCGRQSLVPMLQNQTRRKFQRRVLSLPDPNIISRLSGQASEIFENDSSNDIAAAAAAAATIALEEGEEEDEDDVGDVNEEVQIIKNIGRREPFAGMKAAAAAAVAELGDLYDDSDDDMNEKTGCETEILSNLEPNHLKGENMHPETTTREVPGNEISDNQNEGYAEKFSKRESFQRRSHRDKNSLADMQAAAAAVVAELGSFDDDDEEEDDKCNQQSEQSTEKLRSKRTSYHAGNSLASMKESAALAIADLGDLLDDDSDGEADPDEQDSADETKTISLSQVPLSEDESCVPSGYLSSTRPNAGEGVVATHDTHTQKQGCDLFGTKAAFCAAGEPPVSLVSALRDTESFQGEPSVPLATYCDGHSSGPDLPNLSSLQASSQFANLPVTSMGGNDMTLAAAQVLHDTAQSLIVQQQIAAAAAIISNSTFASQIAVSNPTVVPISDSHALDEATHAASRRMDDSSMDSYDGKTTSIFAIEPKTENDRDLVRAIRKACKSDSPDLRSIVGNYPVSTRLLVSDPNVQTPGQVAVHIAATNGSLKSLQCLLDADADAAFIRDESGNVALHNAVGSGDFAATQMLCSRVPLSAKVQCEEGCLPLHDAVSSASYNDDAPQITAVLLGAFPDAVNITTDEGLLPIHMAAMTGFAAGIRTLFAYNFESIYEQESTEMMLPLDFAVDGLTIEMEGERQTEASLSLNRAFPFMASTSGSSSQNFSDGAISGHEFLSVVRCLRDEADNKENLRTRFRATIELLLMSALYERPILSPRGQKQGDHEFLPLHGAVASRPLHRTWKGLISLYGKDHASKIDKQGQTPMHFLAATATGDDETNIAMIRDLYSVNCDAPSLFDGNGFLPLHLALMDKSSSFELIETIVGCYGAAVTVDVPSFTKNRELRGFLPFQIAASTDSHLDIIYFLLRNHPVGVVSGINSRENQRARDRRRSSCFLSKQN